jgi:transposase
VVISAATRAWSLARRWIQRHFAAQVRSYQDGLRLAGARDHADEDAFRRLPIEALRGELTTAQLASKHGIHQTMVGEWKKQAMEGPVFSDRSAAQEMTKKSSEAEVERLHAKIGPLVVERDFWRKPSLDERREGGR